MKGQGSSLTGWASFLWKIFCSHLQDALLVKRYVQFVNIEVKIKTLKKFDVYVVTL